MGDGRDTGTWGGGPPKGRDRHAREGFGEIDMADYIWSSLRVAGKAGGFILIGIIAGNAYPSQDYGAIVACLLFAGTLGVFLPFRLGASVAYNILSCQQTSERSAIFRAGVVLCALLCAATAVSTFVFKGPLERVFSISYPFWAFSASVAVIVTGCTTMFGNHVLNSQKLFRENAVYLILSLVVQLLLVAFVGWRSASWIYVVASFAAGNAVFSALALARLRAELAGKDSIRVRLSRRHLVRLLPFSTLNYLLSLVFFLDERVDQLFINHYLTKKELAYYSYPVTAAMMFFYIGYAASQVAYPSFRRDVARERWSEIGLLYRRNLDFCFALASIGSLLIVLHAEYLIPWFLPDEYTAMLPPLRILFPGTVMFAAYGSVSSLLVACGRIGWVIAANSTMLAVNIGLNYVLVPRLGMAGAALATSVSFFGRALLGMLLNEKAAGTKYPIGKVLSVYGVMVWIVAFSTGIGLVGRELLLVAYGILVYAVLLCAEDRRMLRSKAAGFFRRRRT